MNDVWYYRVLGEEFGPVSSEALRELIRGGVVGLDDDLRQGTQGAWVKAEAVESELHGGPAADPSSELDEFVRTSVLIGSDEQPGEGPTDDVAAAPAVEWYCEILLEQIGPLSFADIEEMVRTGRLGPYDRIRRGADGKWQAASRVDGLYFSKAAFTAAKTPSEEFPARSGKWYCLIGNDETGPLSFPALEKMVTTGELGPYDRVKEGPGGRWQTASRVDGLYFAKPAVAAPARTAPTTTETTPATSAPVASPAPAKSHRSTRKSDAEIPAAPRVKPQWYCRVSSVEHGPMTFEEVCEWARDRRLSANDDVRQSRGGAWFPAASVGELAAALRNAAPQADSPSPATEAAPAPAPKFAPSAAPATTRTAPPAVAEASRPVAAYTPPQAFAPAPRVRSSGSSLLGNLLGGVVGRLPVILAVLAVVGVGYVLWQFLPTGGSSILGPSDSQMYQSYVALWDELKQLRSKQAADAEWKDFETRSKSVVDGYNSYLSKVDSTEVPGRAMLHYAGRDYWPLMLHDARTNPSATEKQFGECLNQAKTLLNLQ